MQEALNNLQAALDREVLAAHARFEQLSRTETAQVLGIREETAARRYFRALKRLKALWIEISDGSSLR